MNHKPKLNVARKSTVTLWLPPFSQARWQEHDLQVAQKTREERMLELSTRVKEVKEEKILPAKLPAVSIHHVFHNCWGVTRLTEFETALFSTALPQNQET